MLRNTALMHQDKTFVRLGAGFLANGRHKLFK